MEGEKELHDKRAIWEWIKYNIRSHAINFSKIKSQQNKEKETQLENDYSEARRKFEDDPGGGGEGGVIPYISYIGMCRPKGYGF